MRRIRDSNPEDFYILLFSRQFLRPASHSPKKYCISGRSCTCVVSYVVVFKTAVSRFCTTEIWYNKYLYYCQVVCTEYRHRTCMVINRLLLRQVCLPIPPIRHKKNPELKNPGLKYYFLEKIYIHLSIGIILSLVAGNSDNDKLK